MSKTLTIEIEIPLIQRDDRFVAANGNVYFVGVQGSMEERSISYNLFEMDEWGNHLFDGGYETLEQLSTATYDFLGMYETFKVEDLEIVLED